MFNYSVEGTPMLDYPRPPFFCVIVVVTTVTEPRRVTMGFVKIHEAIFSSSIIEPRTDISD